MFEECKTVKLQNKQVKCYDLTYGYVLGVGNGSIEETQHGVVVDASDLSEEEVMKLRGSEVDKLYQAILRLTYPNMYEEDGTPKPISPQTEQEDKKKV